MAINKVMLVRTSLHGVGKISRGAYEEPMTLLRASREVLAAAVAEAVE